MDIGFLIITYGPKYIDNCIQSCKKFHPEIPIYI